MSVLGGRGSHAKLRVDEAMFVVVSKIRHIGRVQIHYETGKLLQRERADDSGWDSKTMRDESEREERRVYKSTTTVHVEDFTRHRRPDRVENCPMRA